MSFFSLSNPTDMHCTVYPVSMGPPLSKTGTKDYILTVVFVEMLRQISTTENQLQDVSALGHFRLD